MKKTVGPIAFSFVMASLSWAKPGLITGLEEEAKKQPPRSRFHPASSRIPNRIRTHSFALGLGQSFLYGDLGKKGKDAITPDFYYHYSASHSFDLLINGHYSSHRGAKDKAVIKGLAFGIRGMLWQFDSFSPYALGGLGFYAPLLKLSDASDSEEKVVVGLHGGIGAELQLNDSLAFGALVHYHNPFDPEESQGEGDRPKAKGSYSKMMVTARFIF
ncbi:MAG: hypothetical protein OXB88_04435 [Bacteriovoracales bacterium]|nr:hypothetical protein [Bacteriovoracales bacterium]